ncbi:MAG: ATP-binding protein, partial [Candidatus Aenigmarchaeota archaeon]|nr:ATP-binding protein [Candidatus Aenigmarchaeota archaeon]
MEDHDIIKALGEMNFWGRDGIYTGIFLPEYMEKIRKFAGSAVVAVIGPRRSGKTTICMQFLEDAIKNGVEKSQTLYVNFEDPLLQPLLADSGGIDAVYRSYRALVNRSKPAIIVLDEVQNVPGWEKWVRVAHEKYDNIKIIVTGSSSKLLSSEVSTVLTGRVLAVFVFPLSFRDFMRFRGIETGKEYEMLAKSDKIRSLLFEYMKYGGFPKVSTEKDRFVKNALLKEYFDGIIFRDIMQRYNIKDIGLVRNLAELCINSISSASSATKMRNILVGVLKRKISPNKVVDSMGYLESSFLVFFVPAFSRKVKEQKLYPKKNYAVDTGMANAVTLKFSDDIGKIAENIAFLQLKR